MHPTKIFGLHSVQAALDYSPDTILKAWIDQKRLDQRMHKIKSTLLNLGIQLETVDRHKLDGLTDGKNHQGIVAEVQLPRVRSENELKNVITTLEQTPFFLILDHVQDPHNLGACLRTADAANANGIIITKDQATGITPTVCKVASGAAESVPVYQTTNLARLLRWMKEQGLWLFGTAGDAEQSIYQADLTVPLAIVLGAEEKGMRRLTRDHCDLLLNIPMFGQVESLNVSVAAGVLMYEVVRQRT